MPPECYPVQIRFGDTRELLWADHFEGLAPALAFIRHCGFSPLRRWLECRDPLELAVELLLGVPQVTGLLHADPQIGTVAARSDIVGGLITLKYVRRQAKRQFLHPTHLLLHPLGPRGASHKPTSNCTARRSCRTSPGHTRHASEPGVLLNIEVGAARFPPP